MTQINPGHINDLRFFKWRRYNGECIWLDWKRPKFRWIDNPDGVTRSIENYLGEPEPVTVDQGTIEWYFPFRENPDIHIVFAELGADKDRILDFADSYGLPSDMTHEQFLSGNHFNWFLSDWVNMSARFKLVLTAIKNNEMQLAENRLNELTNFAAKFKVSISPKYENNRRTINLEPDSLIAAMVYKLIISITEGTDYRKCNWCEGWFTIGASTGRRTTRQYCSSRCKVTAWRADKKLKI